MTRRKAAVPSTVTSVKKDKRKSARVTVERPPDSVGSPPSSKRRSDAVGHLDRAYASELRRLGQERAVRDAVPFFARAYTSDAFAEQLGEHAVESATSGADSGPAPEDDRPEDTMSPFQIAMDALEPGDEEEE